MHKGLAEEEEFVYFQTKSLQNCEITHFKTFECLRTDVTFNSTTITLFCIYRPTENNTDYNNFKEDKILQYISAIHI